MDTSEDDVSGAQINEVVESSQYSDSQDRKKYIIDKRAEENIESVSPNKVKKVRFSDHVDYCDFYTDANENGIDTLSEELLNETPNEAFDVEELASEIESLNISPNSVEAISGQVSTTTTSNVNDDELIESQTSEHQDKEVMLQENEENYSTSSAQKQRSGSMLMQKQTKRLNDILKRDLNNPKAKDFKAAVYRAWTAVKKETKENLPSFVSNKLEDDRAQKSVCLAYVLWKKSKDKELRSAKKVGGKNLLSSNVSQESVKIGKEENEMAFISWKKRKDELLKQETFNRIQNERNAARVTFMNKEEKRKDGESAFLAWKAHKAHVIREEKKKNSFYKEKEQEAIEEKETRDMEALYMYNLWVKSKCRSQQRKRSKEILKPPWYPPGNK